MGFPIQLAIRYARSRKHAFISVGTLFATVGVLLGVAALTTVVSVTGGFLQEFQEKVLGVNAHVLVLKYSSDFREYREVMRKAEAVPGVLGVAPFVINPMMVTHGPHTATGVLLKGVDDRRLASVLDLPRHVVEGKIADLGVAAGPPPQKKGDPLGFSLPDLPPDTNVVAIRGTVEDAPQTADVDAGAKAGTAEPTANPADGDVVAIRGTVEDAPQTADVGASVQAGTAEPTANPADGDVAATRGAVQDSTSPSQLVEERAPTRGGTATHDSPSTRGAVPPAIAPDVTAPTQTKSPAGSGQASTEPSDEPDSLPVGKIQPESGYQSRLPDSDILPEELLADPCQSPEAARTLPGIVVGKTLKENLKLALGDCVQVTSPTIGFSYSGGVIRAPVAKQFRVVAIFDAGFDQYDSKLVYTHLHQAQAFYDSGDSVTGVEMRIADVDRAKPIARELERRLDNGIYHTMDWEELNHGLFTALKIQKILISLVLALIIIVAAFTVIATLIMVVLEKKREIAILKAMGATDSALLRAFLYQGAFIGLVGTSLGLCAGWLTCRLLARYEFPLDPGVYFISRLPVRIEPLEFAWVGVFALAVCLAATVWPALYAARLRPAEAFRSQE